MCCRRTRFLGGAQLRVRWAQVVLDDADLAAPSILTVGQRVPKLDEERWARALMWVRAQRPHEPWEPPWTRTLALELARRGDGYGPGDHRGGAPLATDEMATVAKTRLQRQVLASPGDQAPSLA
jgi:hypothetical protein